MAAGQCSNRGRSQPQAPARRAVCKSKRQKERSVRRQLLRTCVSTPSARNCSSSLRFTKRPLMRGLRGARQQGTLVQHLRAGGQRACIDAVRYGGRQRHATPPSTRSCPSLRLRVWRHPPFQGVDLACFIAHHLAAAARGLLEPVAGERLLPRAHRHRAVRGRRLLQALLVRLLLRRWRRCVCHAVAVGRPVPQAGQQGRAGGRVGAGQGAAILAARPAQAADAAAAVRLRHHRHRALGAAATAVAGRRGPEPGHGQGQGLGHEARRQGRQSAGAGGQLGDDGREV